MTIANTPAKGRTPGDSCHLHGLTAVEGCTTCARLGDPERAQAGQQLDLLAALKAQGVAVVFIHHTTGAES
jgi:hypothetical protein